jgi:arylsulfatase A-like enzyme
MQSTAVERAIKRFQRPVRVGREGGREGARPPHAQRVQAGLSVVASAAWFGLLTGFLELGILVIWHRLAIATVLGALQMNRHFAWMIPVAHLAVFLTCGLPVAILAAFRPALASRAASLLFWTLGCFALMLIVKGLYPAAAGMLAVGLGYQLARRIGADNRVFHRIQRISLPILLGCLAATGAVAYQRLVLEERRGLASLSASAPGAPNVLLVVLDTVRADRLGLYGYGRDTTPIIDRLAGRGVVFSEARSAAPWTLPSHASLFTGRWPHELNVTGDRPLDGAFPTLAEFLAKHGYATAGFVGNTYFCNSWYGLGRGFLHYEDYYEQNIIISPGEALRCTALGRWLIRLGGTAYNVRPETANTPKNAERINHDFLAWLEGNRSERPFFAFLNYMDAHDPYLTPPGFDRHFGLKPESAADVELIRTWYHARKPKDVASRDATLVSDAYDDCLAALDEQLGRLFAALEQNGVLDNTLVILTADHGEEFGEHGLYGHGKSVYREETQVPLLIFGPSRTRIPQGRKIADVVSLRDVAATVVERLGLSDDSPLPGRSLARFWQPLTAPPVNDDPVISEVAIKTRVSHHPKLAPAFRGPLASVIVDGKVYIRDATGSEELYDLARDPAETDNLAGSPASRPALERCRVAFDRAVPGNAARR